MKYLVLSLCASWCCVSGLASAQDLASFEKRITVKKLDNGLTVIICERPEAPVFSFYTHVDAGSVQDPMGQTGMAHMFEHMAFKGTDTIGTTDYAAEKVALAKVEKAYAAYIEERDKRVGRNDRKLKELQKAWQDAIAAAQKYVNPQPVSADSRKQRRRRIERQHQSGRNCLPLLLARKPAGAVGLSRVRPVSSIR